jgi:hypothetical protein
MVAVLEEGQYLEQQQVILLSQLRERRFAAPAMEGPELIKQIIDLIFERQFRKDADGTGVPEALLECSEVKRWRLRRFIRYGGKGLRWS